MDDLELEIVHVDRAWSDAFKVKSLAFYEKSRQWFHSTPDVGTSTRDATVT